MARQVRLEDALNEYLRHCEARGLAAGTVRSHKQTIDALLKTVGNVMVNKIGHRDMDKVFASHTWNLSTRNQRLGQFKEFFKWARARGIMNPNEDPLFGWRNTKVPVVQRTIIPRNEWARLFDACVHPQETILLATGLYLFLRGSEQKLIQLKHVHLDAGEITIHRIKTKEWDVMPICSELEEHLRDHLRWMALNAASDPEHYLIPGRRNDQRRENGRYTLGAGTINPEKPVHMPHLALQRVYERAGYPVKGEGEHTLRRSGARAYFDSLVDRGFDGAMRRVQAMLGHKHSAMTERYLGLDLDRAARNTDLRHQPMFPTSPVNVIQLRKGQKWQNNS